jgi:hypothetical protein
MNGYKAPSRWQRAVAWWDDWGMWLIVFVLAYVAILWFAGQT